MADEQAEPAWKNPLAWLPHSIAEAALSGGSGVDAELPAAWAHLRHFIWPLLGWMKFLNVGLVKSWLLW